MACHQPRSDPGIQTLAASQINDLFVNGQNLQVKYWIQYPICCHFRHNHGDIQFLASRNSQKPKWLKQKVSKKGHIQNQQLHVSNTHKMPLGLEYYTRFMLVQPSIPTTEVHSKRAAPPPLQSHEMMYVVPLFTGG